jgi:hypothetical protein
MRLHTWMKSRATMITIHSHTDLTWVSKTHDVWKYHQSSFYGPALLNRIIEHLHSSIGPTSISGLHRWMTSQVLIHTRAPLKEARTSTDGWITRSHARLVRSSCKGLLSKCAWYFPTIFGRCGNNCPKYQMPLTPKNNSQCIMDFLKWDNQSTSTSLFTSCTKYARKSSY